MPCCERLDSPSRRGVLGSNFKSFFTGEHYNLNSAFYYCTLLAKLYRTRSSPQSWSDWSTTHIVLDRLLLISGFGERCTIVPCITVIICGDLNLPNIDWSTGNCLKCNNCTCSGVFLSFYNLASEQFVASPTRLNNNLDIVLCNDDSGILNVNISQPFSNRDHCSIYFNIVTQLSVTVEASAILLAFTILIAPTGIVF